jgi:hypothetical protein
VVVEPELAGKVGHAVADYLAPVVGQLGLGDLGRDVRAAEKLVEDLAYKHRLGASHCLISPLPTL